jgi:hypothetical protein
MAGLTSGCLGRGAQKLTWIYPIKSTNRKFPLAVLTVGLNPYRKFDDAYRNFIQLIADQISLGVNNALAYEEESENRLRLWRSWTKRKRCFLPISVMSSVRPLMLILGPLEELLNKNDINLNVSQKAKSGSHPP